MSKYFTTYKSSNLRMNTLTALAFVLLTAGLAHAGSRDEAIKVIFVLKQTGVVETTPEEMHSVDDTYAAAEQYYQLNNQEMSERYYLLAIQKARVLLAKLLDLASDTPAIETNQPSETLLASIPPSLQDATPPPPKAETAPAGRQPDPAAGSFLRDVQRIEPSFSPATRPPKTDGDPEHFSDSIISEKLVGNASVYTVVRHDTLRLVAAKLGVSRQYLAMTNKLDLKAPLKVGQKLKFNNRKIIPQRMTNGIVINIPDRTLYYFKQGKLAVSIPVALGVPKKNEKYDWKTPTGKFKIIAKQKDPTWHVPPSIQSEMEEEGKDVITSIPPGPQNPLGKYAIRTSLPGIMIHSTTKPGSIYSFSSHGCIRVYPEQMEKFFPLVNVNTPGEIIYRPVKLAVTETGRVYMEVHQDAYGTGTGLDATAKSLIEKQHLSDRVDWVKVESVIKHKAGIAEDVTL
jgi:L,D-transpeptidase ErfK/SrfK